MKRRLGWITLLALVMISSRLSAQQSTPMINWNGKEVPLRENLVSINPLGGGLSVFQRRIRACGFALGLSCFGRILRFSIRLYIHVGRRDREILSIRARPSRFSIGPTVGYTHVADDYSCYGGCNTTSTNAFTLGVQFDYSWILGPSQHFGIELGLGAKRLFYTGSGSRGSDALPTGRLSVGYSF